MNSVTVSTPFNIYLDFEVASLPRRILAWFIDIAIIMVFAQCMRSFALGMFYDPGSDHYPVGLDFILVTFPILFYHLIMEVVYQGQSLGKKVVGIRVLSLLGGEPNLGQYLMRWIFRVWEWPLLFGVVAFNSWGLIGQFFAVCFLGIVVLITISVTAKHQRLGDMAAGTAVVDTKKQFSINDTVFQEISTNGYKVAFPEVMRLSDRDINAIKAVLTQTRETGRYETAHRIASRVKEVLTIDTRLEVTDFLEKLLDDYNYLATKND
ncbi:MAG: RDD family protein [Chitinophagaceae bacterium]|nr:RDD family protein [Chitinophagaceae bacterium]